KKEARRLRAAVDPRRAAPQPDAPASLRSHTTYLCVIDEAGNAVSLIQSIFREFGCGLVVPGTGIVLNDRATCFSMDRSSPNALASGKKPVHTLTPCMVMDDAGPALVLGTPGGQSQVQVLFQLLVK